jgi:hypothetical protein
MRIETFAFRRMGKDEADDETGGPGRHRQPVLTMPTISLIVGTSVGYPSGAVMAPFPYAVAVKVWHGRTST